MANLGHRLSDQTVIFSAARIFHRLPSGSRRRVGKTLSVLTWRCLRPGAGLGITREEADFGGIWLPGGVGAAGAFPRRWEALRHFGVRALVFGPTPISQS